MSTFPGFGVHRQDGESDYNVDESFVDLWKAWLKRVVDDGNDKNALITCERFYFIFLLRYLAARQKRR